MALTNRAAAALVALTVVVSAGTGRADPALPVLQNAGMLATWAFDCGQPPSVANSHMIFYDAGSGFVRRLWDRGDERPRLDGTVDNAQKLTGTSIRMTLRNDDPKWEEQNGRTYETVVKIEGGRLYSLSSVDSAGVEFIKDGKFISSGNPTPIFQRCRK